MSKEISAKNAKDGDWKAWFNVMPSTTSATPTLNVLGSVDMGNVSDSATLVFDSLEKSLPPNLVVRIKYQEIFIPRNGNDTVVLLHYTYSAAPGQIGKVIVVYPDGTHLTIDPLPIAT